MPNIEEKELLKLMLEEMMPTCLIEGLESSEVDTSPLLSEVNTMDLKADVAESKQ